MFEVLQSLPHLAAYRFSGILTADDYDACIADIEARLARHRRIGIYCDMLDITGITPAAVARDLRYTLGRIGQFERFARGAIVTDQRWLAAVTGVAARFFPATEIRSFERDQAGVAMAWAGAVDPDAAAVS
ncbi:SpoIIAA family protein [Pseudoxanthomonas sp. 10H]|uniref:STAS/SEC14 domain-containing protein n=1 Tax=Pseudoxanthomonas sp. 10H TaxID=3242729 RepID=UPI0035578224